MNGILNILKPPGMTSHDVVAITRRVLKTPRVGHTGTLDPMAAGVLPVCVGQATRVVEWLQEDQKKYRAELILGIETDTQDRWGTCLVQKPVQVTAEQLLAVLKQYTGVIQQIPPMYSALKVNGKKLCDLARAGITVEREPRTQIIDSIELVSFDGERAMIDVVCSKGTYIRTLIHDIGQSLETGAAMSFLLRTGTGAFGIETSISIETLKSFETPADAEPFLYPMEYAFSNFPRAEIPESLRERVRNGVQLELSKFLTQKPKENSPVAIFIEGQFVALGHYDVALNELKIRRHFLGQGRL